MTHYGHQSRNIDRLTRTAPRETQAQWSRRTGRLLPMDQPRKRLWDWVMGR